jgi:uncharacterized protein affecting Mg2+/Co2+ transport
MIKGKRYNYSGKVITYLRMITIPIAGHMMPHMEFMAESGAKFNMTIKEFERLKLQEVI